MGTRGSGMRVGRGKEEEIAGEGLCRFGGRGAEPRVCRGGCQGGMTTWRQGRKGARIQDSGEGGPAWDERATAIGSGPRRDEEGDRAVDGGAKDRWRAGARGERGGPEVVGWLRTRGPCGYDVAAPAQPFDPPPFARLRYQIDRGPLGRFGHAEQTLIWRKR